IEGPADGRDARFGCIALPPGTRVEGIADLVAGPAFRLPRPDLAQPLSAGLLDHAEHPETLHQPRTGLPEEPAPGLGAGDMATDEAGGLGVGLEFGEAV